MYEILKNSLEIMIRDYLPCQNRLYAVRVPVVEIEGHKRQKE